MNLLINSLRIWMVLIAGGKIRKQEKKSYGSSFWKTPIGIEDTNIPYGRGDEDVCNEVFCCRSNGSILGYHCCLILGWNLFLRELRKLLIGEKLGK